MRARLPALVMAALLALYLVFAIYYAVQLLLVPELVARLIGVALLVLPLIGVWALVAELRFGVRAQRLVQRLAAEGGLPFQDAERRPSGRVQRDEADAAFPAFAAEVQEAPESWRAWFRLSLAYDASGDRRRARQAARRAIALASTARPLVD